MHEMGIASSVLDAVRVETARHPGTKPVRVGLRIGEWAGVDTESLRFCFDALVAGSGIEGLRLELDYRVRRHRCKECGKEFEVREYEVRCPACGSDETAMTSGMELDIAFLELEDA